jgi:formate hydrogenlyase transcriptional activator
LVVGNVREFENLIERAVILAFGSELTVPLAYLGHQSTSVQHDRASTLEGVERAHITRVLEEMLEETNWVVGGPRGAAARLGIKLTTLQSMIKRFAIARSRDVVRDDDR